MAIEGAPIFNEPEGGPATNPEGDSSKKKTRKNLFELLNAGPPPKPPEHLEKSKDDEDEEEPGRSWFEPAAESTPEPKAETLDEQIEVVAAATEPASEAEAPTGHTSEAEEAAIVPQVAAAIREAQAEQLPDPATDAPAEAFYEAVKAGVPPDEAEQQVIERLGGEAAPDESVEASEVMIDLRGAEAAPIDATAEDEPDAAAATPTPSPHGTGTPPPMPPTGGPGAGFGGGPGAPTPPGGPGGPPLGPLPPFGPPHGPAFGPPGGSAGFNVAPPPPPAPNRPPRIEVRDQANPAAMALFGGIIGYLIGRRRGRIKTEKKLLPIQKKLEKRVDDLQWQLQEKEANIRRIAAQKARQQGPAVIEKFVQAGAEQAKPEPVPAPWHQSERVRRTAEQLADTRQRAPEAHQLHREQPAPERNLGQMMMAGAEKAPTLNTEKRVETLSRAELLNLSEKIIVDGSSLRQIYETHLIGERGLRRLIQEHLQGGDLKKALRREVVEREIDFERDPAMRDQAPMDASSPAAGAQVALNQMIEKASANVRGGNEQLAYYKARTDFQEREQEQARKRRQMVDISIGVVIVTLIAAVVMLYIMRS